MTTSALDFGKLSLFSNNTVCVAEKYPVHEAQVFTSKSNLSSVKDSEGRGSLTFSFDFVGQRGNPSWLLAGSSRVGMVVKVRLLRGLGIYSCIELGGESLWICKGTPETESVGAPPLLCTYGWIMTHIPQMLVLPHRQPFCSLSPPLPELSNRNIHLCPLWIKTKSRSCCRLFRKALVLKSRSSVVGLILPPSRWASWVPCTLLVLCFMH